MGVLLSDDTVADTFIWIHRGLSPGTGLQPCQSRLVFSSDASGADWCPRVVSGWPKRKEYK